MSVAPIVIVTAGAPAVDLGSREEPKPDVLNYGVAGLVALSTKLESLTLTGCAMQTDGLCAVSFALLASDTIKWLAIDFDPLPIKQLKSAHTVIIAFMTTITLGCLLSPAAAAAAAAASSVPPSLHFYYLRQVGWSRRFARQAPWLGLRCGAVHARALLP